MSFQSDVEHLWAPPETLAPTLRHHFKDGVCTVFADEELAAAIPASQKQANILADLMESFAIALDDDFSGAGKDYFTLRDELCAPLGHVLLTKLFKQEMEKEQQREEANARDKRTILASAAKPRKHELN